MESQVKKVSKEIASEIAQRSMIDIDGISVMIEVAIKDSMLDFINEYSTREERQYLKLLNEQSKNKVGSRSYNELAFKLTVAKSKKAAANRTANNLRREDNFEKLKNWVILKYGRDVFDDFISEEVPDLPSFPFKKITEP